MSKLSIADYFAAFAVCFLIVTGVHAVQTAQAPAPVVTTASTPATAKDYLKLTTVLASSDAENWTKIAETVNEINGLKFTPHQREIFKERLDARFEQMKADGVL